jgi:hypothetical protein
MCLFRRLGRIVGHGQPGKRSSNGSLYNDNYNNDDESCMIVCDTDEVPSAQATVEKMVVVVVGLITD